MANYLTLDKKITREDALKPLIKIHPDKDKDFNAFLDSFNDPFSLIPEDVKPDSDEYIHFRYNI